MKIALFIISIMLFLAGLTFFLQGINVLPGSYMTGNPQWAINGAIIMVVSGGLLWFARRR
jgi:divalent metal cation (Fe/Co/Zn/Cd) transporter